MTSEYNVVGEHKSDEQHLLVVGDDGQYYDYSLSSERVEPIEPDENWQVDEPVGGDDSVPGTDIPFGGDLP